MIRKPITRKNYKDFHLFSDEDYNDNYDDGDDVSEQNSVQEKNTVNLLQPPYFQKTEYKKRVKAGENVALECLVKNLDSKYLTCDKSSYISLKLSFYFI